MTMIALVFASIILFLLNAALLIYNAQQGNVFLCILNAVACAIFTRDMTRKR